MIAKDKKFAIFMEDSMESDYGKMGIGVMRYSPNPILCVIDTVFAGKTVREAIGQPFDVPVVSSIEKAHQMGAEVLVLGTSPSGGKLPLEWDAAIRQAVTLGMSLINGLHDDLNARYGHLLDPTIRDHIIWDVRKPAQHYPIATAKAAELNNKRVLMVGTDMAVGKMTAGLEIYKWIKDLGHSTAFLATGQIGITVTGNGIPLDAILVDKACGAVEHLVLSAAENDIVFIEGQGSILNPGSTATLPLMRGSCATHLILCLRGDKTHLRKPTHIKIPPLKDFIALNEALTGVCGSLTQAKCVGIAVNSSKMDSQPAAMELIHKIEEETGLPTVDVILQGPQRLAEAILNT